MATKEGFDNIRLEPVGSFTKWIRGKESLTMFSPRPTPQKLDLIGLGRSISGNVKADAIVFRSFDELESNKDKIRGKIVVYNQKWTTYGDSVQYRSQGADRAAKYGAVAALVRSVASYSISSVHTGMQSSTAIPIAAITVEDAEMFQRMQDRGQKITLQLVLEN
jgi:carboxypeptidase Q